MLAALTELILTFQPLCVPVDLDHGKVFANWVVPSSARPQFLLDV